MKRVRLLCASVSLGFVILVVGAGPGKAAGKGDPAKGKEIFEQCSVCHNADSTEKKTGPGLKGLFKRQKMQDGKKISEATVRARIDAGGGGMPPYKEMLTDEEKDNLLAYLKTL